MSTGVGTAQAAAARPPVADDNTGLRVTRVETLVVNARLRNWVFVRVRTNVDGLYGWGEATLEWRTRAVAGAVEDVAPLLLGHDPLRREFLWQEMYRQQFFKGGAVTLSAISGIDQALHDIAGKVYGVPVFELLGGRVRDEVRFYDHLGGGDRSSVYGLKKDGADLADLAAMSLEAGFDALKFLPLDPGPMLTSSRLLDDATARVAAVRGAVGPNVDVMLDLHGRTTPEAAIKLAERLHEYDPWFLEEPCQPEDVAGLSRVARATSIPVAAGERIYTRFGFRPLFESAACAVAQPDVCHCGGLTELMKIASMADAYGVAVAPHNPLGPVATMASLHFAFCTPNFLIQEVMRSDVPWRDEIVGEPLPLVDGRVAPPTAPGLGIDIDERAAARHPFEPEPQIRTYLPDGAVGDW